MIALLWEILNMWPLLKIRNDSLNCIFTPRKLILSYTSQHATNNNIVLHAYEEISCAQAELESIILCNSSSIKKTIEQFIQKNNISDETPLNFALCGPTIQEKITNKKNLIDSSLYKTYLYALAGKKFYYTVSISPALIMQYQLLAMALKQPISLITTPFIAQCNLYKFSKKNSFSSTQLAQDLRKNNHHIEHSFNDDYLVDLFYHNRSMTINYQDDKSFLLTIAGLFYHER